MTLVAQDVVLTKSTKSNEWEGSPRANARSAIVQKVTRAQAGAHAGDWFSGTVTG